MVIDTGAAGIAYLSRSFAARHGRGGERAPAGLRQLWDDEPAGWKLCAGLGVARPVVHRFWRRDGGKTEPDGMIGIDSPARLRYS